MVLIYFVRHGETAHNRDGIGLGRSDIALTDFGRAQAAAVGRRFIDVSVAEVYTSPLSRAKAVAQAMSMHSGSVPVVHDALTEMDVGETEGLAFPEMRQRFPAFLADWAGPLGHQVRMPGGESIGDVALRLAPLLQLLRNADAQALAVVSHNFVLRVLLCELLGLGPAAFRAFTVDLASVSAVGIDRGRASLHYLNDTCHLADLNVDQRRVSL